MKHILGIFIGIILVAGTAAASNIFHETEAAYEASQAARNKGVEAFRAGDLVAALVHMEEALSHRPNNPLLLGYVAYLAAETGKTDRAEEVAKRYAVLGLVPADGIRASLENALSKEPAHEVSKAFLANLQPRGNMETKFLLPATFELVEGIAVDSNGRFYFGSVVSGSIVRMDATGPSKIVEARQHEFGSFFGMAMHESSLYVTFAQISQTPGYTEGEGQTGVARIDPETGDVLQVWTLPDSTTNQQIADIAISSDGGIYVSDALGRKIYRITAETLFPAFAHDGFMSPQGIAETGGGHLILADYGRGLWRLDRESGHVTLLGAPMNISLHGIDGLIWHGGKLIALQNGVTPHRVLAIDISADGTYVEKARVVAQGFGDYGEPTLGVSTSDGLYFIAGSQWPSYGDGGILNEGMEAKPTPVMKLID